MPQCFILKDGNIAYASANFPDFGDWWQAGPDGTLPVPSVTWGATYITNYSYTTNYTYITNYTYTTNYNPGILLNGSNYQWRIDATNTDGVTTGDVWAFIVTNLPVNKPKLYGVNVNKLYGNSSVKLFGK